MGIPDIIRGKPHKTTIPDKKALCPLDKANRQFRVPAPNMLWVSNFTYVVTWKGFVYVAPRHGHSDQWRSHGSIIDAYARRIRSWCVSTSAHAGFVLDALEQAVHDRRPGKGMGLVYHSERGSQYLSIKNTERLAEAGIEPSVGSVGDSYDRAMVRHWSEDHCEGAGRDDQRSLPLQSRSHPPPWPLAQLRGGRICHARMALRRCTHCLPANRSTGSTTAACLSQSGTFRPQKPRPTSTQLWKLNLWPRN